MLHGMHFISLCPLFVFARGWAVKMFSVAVVVNHGDVFDDNWMQNKWKWEWVSEVVKLGEGWVLRNKFLWKCFILLCLIHKKNTNKKIKCKCGNVYLWNYWSTEEGVQVWFQSHWLRVLTLVSEFFCFFLWTVPMSDTTKARGKMGFGKK